jgi:hypothetical protein
MSKPSKRDLIVAIEKAIGVLSQVYRNNADESDLYEASLLVLALEAAESAGGTVLLTQDGRTPASTLGFRRAPGNLWRGDFTYALVSFPDHPKQLEIHLGVYVLGSSRVAHECDVAVIDHLEAERSRRGQVHPRHSKLIASIEAKNHSTSPDLGIGRAFLGLSMELGQNQCSLAFPSKSRPNLAALIAKKRSEAYDELLPGKEAAARLRSHLDQSIRNWTAGR